MFRQKPLMLLVALAFLASFAVSVFAVNIPLGPDTLDYVQSETSNIALYPPKQIDAEAGNITEITITGRTQTKSWQGFYGNVSGTIILEDAQGNRFYDWTAAEPKGEVYASVNETISWTTVECAPTSTDITFLDSWQTFYGMNYTDYDTINTTYTNDTHQIFYTGYNTLDNCPTTFTYVNNVSQTADFEGVLLTSDSNSTLIFTALLEDKAEGMRADKVGFDGGEYDFQLLVAEDGSAANTVVTPYFFWVELE
ncbi:MAG: hypothetical protein WC758_04635 [Candidatus Woesearchaeota archaeon]|jgi:hypothetical protein